MGLGLAIIRLQAFVLLVQEAAALPFGRSLQSYNNLL